jgi:hypothetical protein
VNPDHCITTCSSCGFRYSNIDGDGSNTFHKVDLGAHCDTGIPAAFELTKLQEEQYFEEERAHD